MQLNLQPATAIFVLSFTRGNAIYELIPGNRYQIFNDIDFIKISSWFSGNDKFRKFSVLAPLENFFDYFPRAS